MRLPVELEPEPTAPAEPPTRAVEPGRGVLPRPGRVGAPLLPQRPRHGALRGPLLFSVAALPGIVSLAGGMPDVSALPSETMAGILADVVREHGPTALQYGSAQGDPGLRESICSVMAAEGISARPEDVMVTVGSQQALDLLARVLLDPGTRW